MLPPSGPRILLFCLLVAAVYLATGALGLSLASFGDQVTLLWAPTGLSLGALVVGGRRLWPGVWLGALLTNLWIGSPPWVAVVISIGNTLEAVVGAWLLERYRFARSLDRLQDVFLFLVVGVCGASLIAATVGATTLVASGAATLADAPKVWLLWWLGDATGALVVAPVLMTRDGWRRGRALGEALVLAALLVATAALAFGTTGAHTHPLSILPFTLVFAAALRLGVPIASALMALAAAFAALGALQNTGPFMHGGTLDLPQTWAYLVLLGTSMLVAASLVAERRTADQERRRVESSALEAQHLEGLGLIAAGVAHDFNNLLQVIQGHAALARHDAQADHLDQIDASVDQASQLCDQLLTYAGKAPRRVESVSLKTELAAIRGLVHASTPAGVALSIHDEPQDVIVRCDRGQLHRAVLNLLNNAAEASRDTGGRIDVRYGRADLSDALLQGCAIVGAGTQPGDYGWLEVSDHGSGMGPEVTARLFEPFFTTHFHGRGLGLASVAGIARTHGGAIEVESRLGHGTRIRMWLPWTSERPMTPVPPPAPTAPTGPTKILLVDDDDAVRQVAKRMLEHAGYEVVPAASGQEALDICEDPALRAVVLDYTMPGMDGRETAERMRRKRPDLPVLICSGGSNPVEGDADAFLQKPYRPRELERAMAALLDSSPPDGRT